MCDVDICVNNAFREITKIGYFDIVEGNKPIPEVYNFEMCDIPEKMSDYVKKTGYGCCFVFSAYMLNVLNKNGIKAYMIATREDDGIRASVLYKKDGKYFVANPVEDIEYFTEKDIKPVDREKYYLKDTSMLIKDNGEMFDASCYTLKEFSEKYGEVWYIGSMYFDSHEIFSEQMIKMRERCIAPLQYENYKLR